MNRDNRERIRQRLNTIIFGADTPLGRGYDLVLLGIVAVSVLMVMLDSVSSFHASYGRFFYACEWVFTLFFTIEYLVRLWCGENALRYAFSFFGIVDFLGVVPTYLSLITRGSRYLVAIRFLRVLRVFRVMKLSSYEGEVRAMGNVLRASGRRILVFLFFVMTMVVVLGSLMYVVEGEANGFTSIPISIYWAIVTLTTVGYGDISPGTPLGQAVAALLMILGYSIIVVPTGIVSVAASRESQTDSRRCTGCRRAAHDGDASHCKFCGSRLE
ncbi:MAG: ion transporter [Lentisphaerae bacterium]|nr:ion transporter [Lentisphaerota bacterium]